MNKRDYKSFAAGECYHIFNRGNDKKDIFRDSEDYDILLFRLREILGYDKRSIAAEGHLSKGALLSPQRRVTDRSNRYQRKSFPFGTFSLIAYCLMPNHFHFILQQNTDIPISELMMSLMGGYSKIFNNKYGRVGSLFQDQFKSIRVEDNTQLLHLSAYIHFNPKIAGIVSDPMEYKYSSYREYIGIVGKDEMVCNQDLVLQQFANIDAYKAFMDESLDTIQRNKELKKISFD